MFGSLLHTMGTTPDVARPRTPPPPTPVKFPNVTPRDPSTITSLEDQPSLRTFLRTIQRATDVRLEHLESLGLHVIPDSALHEIIPDPSFLPPDAWRALTLEAVGEAHDVTRPLNNGRNAPGVKTFLERVKELSIPNSPAFRSIRRLPPAPGDLPARLGNAYEFFRNLELLSGFWVDTSLPAQPAEPAEPSDTTKSNSQEAAESEQTTTATDDESSKPDSAQPGNPKSKPDPEPIPAYLQIHIRTGTGSQTPPDFRNALLAAFVKLVAYDFTCNVSLPRVEPRLHIARSPGPSILTPTPTPAPNPTPPTTSPDLSKFPHTSPPTSFASNLQFIYRTPSDRSSARNGIVEGPLATLSARHTTVFERPLDELLDLSREVIASLVTAQQRARESKEETKIDKDDPRNWWCVAPRWGGGTGGPIGKEESREPAGLSDEPLSLDGSGSEAGGMGSSPALEARRGIVDAARAVMRGAGNGPGKRRTTTTGGRKTMSIYDNYRMVRPPSSTWDRKARYQAIGRERGKEWDDVFVVSALNHHVSVARVRVPLQLVRVLDGEEEELRVVDGRRQGPDMWRSRWYDMFLVEDRIEAMRCIWGMMGWLMRKVDQDKVDAGGDSQMADA